MEYKCLFRVLPLFAVLGLTKLCLFSPISGTAAEITAGTGKEAPPLPMELELLLKCEYVDGEISEETVTETIYRYEDFWEKYGDWEFIGIENEKMVWQRKVDDISPLLKTNGYFGVTEDGILTIFNGRPDKAHIIHSFFQIDVGKLESRKKEELLEGIPVKTKDRYVEVLETFEPYTKQEIEAR